MHLGIQDFGGIQAGFGQSICDFRLGTKSLYLCIQGLHTGNFVSETFTLPAKADDPQARAESFNVNAEH